MRDQRVAHVSHIQLEASNANMGQLVAWKEKIGNDEEAFASIATQHSACRSAAKGGDLGYLTRGERAPRAPPPPGLATHPPPLCAQDGSPKSLTTSSLRSSPGRSTAPSARSLGCTSSSSTAAAMGATRTTRRQGRSAWVGSRCHGTVSLSSGSRRPRISSPTEPLVLEDRG